MIRKLLLLIIPFTALLILSSSQMSDNGKAGKTGSPNELTCIDCHSSFSPNTGGGSITIQSPGTPGFQYTAGQTYSMSVTVAKASVSLFGVGIEALTSSNLNAGTLIITDAASTRIKNATVSTVSRVNVVHTLGGGAGAGSKVFNFDWTAPTAGTGNVTFYFAGIAANGAGNEAGDYVYNSSQIFTESTCLTPAQPGTMSGSSAVCQGTSHTYSVPADTGITSYTWTLPSGWNGTSTTNSITASAGTSGTITVTANNACGPSAQRTFTVSVSNITATQNVTDVSCFGGNNGSATLTPSGGIPAYTYLWSPSGGTAATANNLTSGTYTVTITDGAGCSNTATVNINQATAMTVGMAHTNALCANENGTATATPTGGTSPYTYLWTPGGGTSATATVPAGTYTVTVSDSKNCNSTQSVTINQPTVLAVGVTTTNTNCISATGTATASPSGGTTPYTYHWSTVPAQTTATAINLGGGNYTITVTDSNGCTITDTAQVIQPSSLSANTNFIMPGCYGGNNGQAFVNVTGGTPAYTYLWNTTPPQTTDTAFNLTAGTYSVTITDSALCSYFSSVTVTEPAQLVANAGSSNSICEGAVTILNGSANGGVSGYTYLWSPATGLSSPTDPTPSATPVSTTPYSLTVTDANGCTSSSTVTINLLVTPNANLTIIGETLFSTTGDNYSWYYNGNLIPGANDSAYVPSQNGDYYVIVSNTNGCSDTSAVFPVTTVGITSLSTDASISVYPNPAGSYLTIAISNEYLNHVAQLIDVCGKPVISFKLTDSNNYLDLSGIAKGYYTLIVNGQNSKVAKSILKSN